MADDLFKAASRHVVIHEPARVTTGVHHRRWLVMPADEDPAIKATGDDKVAGDGGSPESSIVPLQARSMSERIRTERRNLVTTVSARLGLRTGSPTEKDNQP